MSEIKRHLAQAEYNESFAEEIKHDHPDWAIVVLFYAALHHVDACMLKYGYKPENHEARFNAMAKIPALKGIYSDYRALSDYSRNARYDMKKFNTEDVTYAQENFYAAVKAAVKKDLEKKAEKKPVPKSSKS